ncbi:MAG: sodium-dependent transporter [Deltaproteobacteria bacterium]|nr:sodium-dependent transporter [Deltaproteobacteria bacterium]
MSRKESHQRSGARLGVRLAVAGSAVGLGNFLRFPGQAAQNGGGAFMIPYFCALIFLGIPIGWAEWVMGRYGGRKGLHSAPAIMGLFSRGAAGRYLGSIGVLIPLAVSFYYTFIESWCLAYCWRFLTGGIGIDPGAPTAQQTETARSFFRAFSGVAADGSLFSAGGGPTLVFFLVAFAVNVWLVFRGISKGIEKFCTYAMPVMAVCALIVLVRVLTLGTPDPSHPEQNVLAGLGYMWNPNFSALGNFRTWLAAAGQIFFTLSVGFGVIINYASYLKKDDDVALSGLTASATNEVFEVGFGGLITLTAAFIFLGATGTAEAVGTGSFGLGFNTLPVVFAHMGILGNAVGAIWFFMLFLAAITSSISMYQPALAFAQESLGLERKRATSVLVGLCLVGSTMVMWFSKDGVFLDTIDFWVGSFLVFIMAALQIICFSWIFGLGRGKKEANSGAQIRIPGFMWAVMRYVAPVYVIVVFVGFCVQKMGESARSIAERPAALLALGLVAAMAIVLIVCVRLGERRWRGEGLDIDDREPS